ncbi:6-phosphogluconolactonase [Thalassovita taeanensis]|uniref:6-phosphogluconolactonase n=1 Tax=Thalassovita taeanensis TaxID=657014 RepID=A0A1H8YXM5_9RHOB|nr:6-phosphogluconolactonase [Thalassovita taeanensis]SEP56944.1 6-phosphogluconolactonase [Thalassovita taeanensis]
MTFLEYPDREMMAIDLANSLAAELSGVLMHEERASFVVPGGTTPGPVFDSLCAADLDWDRVDVLLSDERWVPLDHPRSNTRLLRERLLVGRAAAAHLLPMYAQTDQAEQAIPELEAALRPCLPISVALLGMGSDMHTASLFPRGDNLRLALDPHAPILIPMRADGTEDQRLSLSARVLREALSLHVVITGNDKRDALERARHLTPQEAPVAAILDYAIVHWAE